MSASALVERLSATLQPETRKNTKSINNNTTIESWFYEVARLLRLAIDLLKILLKKVSYEYRIYHSLLSICYRCCYYYCCCYLLLLLILSMVVVATTTVHSKQQKKCSSKTSGKKTPLISYSRNWRR